MHRLLGTYLQVVGLRTDSSRRQAGAPEKPRRRCVPIPTTKGHSMTADRIKDLLGQVASGKLSPKAAAERLAFLGFTDIGYAKVDSGRARRCGFPEVVYCEGKSSEHLRGIAEAVAGQEVLLATRASPEAYEQIKAVVPKAVYHAEARIVVADRRKRKRRVGRIVVASAGTADFPVAEEAAVVAEVMGNHVERLYDAGVAGVHRLLAHSDVLAKARVIVAVAGMEGALPGVVAGLVGCPVIGVPTSVGYGASFGGIAALLTMLNTCANGVAVVNIDNGYGAGCLASMINQTHSGAART